MISFQEARKLKDDFNIFVLSQSKDEFIIIPPEMLDAARTLITYFCFPNNISLFTLLRDFYSFQCGHPSSAMNNPIIVKDVPLDLLDGSLYIGSFSLHFVVRHGICPMCYKIYQGLTNAPITVKKI